MILKVEGKSEQEREDGVGFAGKNEEEHVPQVSVEALQPIRRARWKGVEVKMLYVMEQYDTHDGEAPERIDGQHPV